MVEARQALGLAEGDLVIGSVGNFRYAKGQRYLLEAFALVVQQVPDAKLVLIGRGSMERDLREIARQQDVHDRVIFAGYRAHAAALMMAFDVFALPSLYEGLPIALVEAIAVGRPCVVTRVGGVPEVVTDRENGLVVEPGDTVALAGALTTLLLDAPLQARYGAAALERASAFDIRSTVKTLERLYRQYAAAAPAVPLVQRL